MASVVKGYSYDIFISYRQKDNRSDKWVTHFVNSLQDELDAAFKEDISVYFDEDPHDGLQDNHDVDDSLAEKVKCLVFIPILSRTYCDPSSFAWQKEFLEFRDFAQDDKYGLDIKLLSGNSAKRILPVQIHDIDPQDQELYEKETGGVLRPVKFIYAEPGVNRPLKRDDNPDTNLNKTRFRNQINKTANAIRDLISAMRDEGITETQPILEEESSHEVPFGSNKKRNTLIGILVPVVLLVAYLGWDFLGRDSGSSHKYDLAVMYLENLTDDEKYTARLINLIDINLSEDTSFHLLPRNLMYEELRNIDPDAKEPDQSVAREIAASLDVKNMMIGRVIQEGMQVLVQLELIEVETGKVLARERMEGDQQNIFSLADEITFQLVEGYIESPDYNVSSMTTNSYSAFNLFYEGLEYYWDLEWSAAIDYFDQAIEVDSTFAMAYLYKSLAQNPFGLSNIYRDLAEQKVLVDQAKSYSARLPTKEKLLLSYIDQLSMGKMPDKTILERAYSMDSTDLETLGWYAQQSLTLGNTDKAISLTKEYLERFPSRGELYNFLAYMYASRGEPDRAVQAVNEYRKTKPNIYNSLQSQWEIEVMAGNAERSRSLAEELIKTGTNEEVRWLALHTMIFESPEETLKLFNKVKDSVSSNETHTIEISANLMLGRVNEALTAIKQNEDLELEREHQNHVFMYRLKRPLILMFSGNFQQSEEEFISLIEDSDALETYNPYKFLGYFYLANLYATANELEKAEICLQNMRGILDEKPDFRLDSYLEQARMMVLQAKGQWDEIDRYFENVQLNFVLGTNPRWLYLRLEHFIHLKDYSGAIDMIESPGKFLLMGRLIFGGNQVDFAHWLMNREYYLGRVEEARGNMDLARTHYRNFLESLKDSPTDFPLMKEARRKLQ